VTDATTATAAGTAPAAAPVAALGAGRMGRGIALTYACAGQPVLLVDAKARTAEEFGRLRTDAWADLRGQVDALVDLGLVPSTAIGAILARVTICDRESARARLANVDLVFEGVPERMDAKADAFEFACDCVPDGATIASTSSTFLSTALADMVRHPRRFLNAHWLNPAHLIPLVEFSPHPGTDPAVTRRLRERLEAIGKVTVTCGPTPGYIVPRMQVLIMNEAARMIESGAASAEDIDRAIRYGFGLRYAAMGVVEFIDVGGNDILHYASRYLTEALGDARYASPPIVGRYMAEGRNGLRSGQGFYDWTGRDVAAYRRETTARFVELLRTAGRLPMLADAATGPPPAPGAERDTAP
jgi:3-hydroxybutyryl-CoA dehydrogenase